MSLPSDTRPGDLLTLFLCGDVMTGRGVDQILPQPAPSRLYEPYLRSARGYVRLAEERSGPIPDPVGFDYIWGDALAELARRAPTARIVNLETAVTTHDRPWPGKGIHYRMHPRNLPCLTAAGVNCCVLANNHVLDWEHPGLEETLDALTAAGIRVAGAGRTREEAARPAALATGGGGRVLVFAYGCPSSGIPPSWAATDTAAGVNLLADLSARSAEAVSRDVIAARRPGDVVIVSVHWGGNWGYEIPRDQKRFARSLIRDAGVDVIHGHSSHHPKGIEVYRERLILYGCGDFLNDYEGIAGHERFRSELVLMYLPALDPSSGALRRLRLVPLRIRRFRLERASAEEAEWLRATVSREGRPLGTRVESRPDGELELRWT